MLTLAPYIALAATIDLRRSVNAVNTATCSLHGNTLFRNGGLTNPDPKLRDLARLKVDRTLRIGAMFGAKHFTYWVARDGFEVPVTVDWKNVYTWLAAGLDHVWDYVKAKKLTNYVGATIEPKPNEPRGHMYLPTAGHAGVVPPITVNQLVPPATTCALVDEYGAAAATSGTLATIAVTSSRESVVRAPLPRLTPPVVTLPGLMTMRLAPRLSICFRTTAWAPAPIATEAITAPTPMMIPSMVRSDLLRLRRSAFQAVRRSTMKLMLRSLPSPDDPRQSIRREM